ncbi:MAG: GxxExxY protein [Chitinophagaceae bacterium]|nr:GxxExxY protein [Chitinophagaceae bacterium]
MQLNDLTYKIRGGIFNVHSTLGLGLFETVYEAALMYELESMGLKAKCQVGLPVHYKETKLELGFRADIVVEDQVIIEIKSVEALHDVHKKQLLNYLKLTKMKVGFLVNFNVVSLEDKLSLIRIIN